ncbi:GH3 auxin-responsive promoter [Psychroflexus salarius]|uniref:GH3 auxin-responsive promoter n=1 Tax=Psychroflexus salarius TaxID=1155689 RepID=A0A1M4USW3_9FLAO|nr:GH3 auxin-responsive promoter family protein [Psychroflexus salarius]SHE59727.1 GH3 auxin-responsive promoter [Psychroflexus salarius]
MSIKSIAAKLFAKHITKKMANWSSKPVETQQRVFETLIASASETQFGKDHHFETISTPEAFRKNVPIRDYEALKPYIDQVVEGVPNILWPGKPLYFAKTSGTTSGAKYIPLTKASMPTHINAARNAILCYIAETGRSKFVDGKMIFLQGNPKLEEKNGIKLGRLSGIVAHFVPNYLQKNRLPSWETNCIDDWETKLNAVVNETISEDMTVFSGIPSWVQTYFEKLVEISGQPIGKLYKNLELFIYGGVNYEPYRSKFEQLIGRKIASIELYPASEGFFAFQDSQTEKGMLLQLNSGIFYEFIKVEEFYDENPQVYTIATVEVNVNYVMIISTNAGLWRYNLGDTVMFVNKNPYRLVVSGRIKHFTSAFGEHVIAKEVEESLQIASEQFPIEISEFTVAPQINPKEGLPYHEWFIEFNNKPKDLSQLAKAIDQALQQQNSYYKDLRSGQMLQCLKITSLPKHSFAKHMESIGKLGGQNKVPRLSNDRKIAESLEQFK